MRLLSAAIAILSLFLVGSHGLAQETKLPFPKSEPAEKAKTLYTSLKNVIDYGATLFNEHGDYAGCYRVYQGALIAIRPSLVEHPDLLKAVDESLRNTEKIPRVSDRAFALRKSLDAVRDRFAPLKPGEERIPSPKKIENKKNEEVIPDPKKVDPKIEPGKEDPKKPEPKDRSARSNVGVPALAGLWNEEYPRVGIPNGWVVGHLSPLAQDRPKPGLQPA